MARLDQTIYQAVYPDEIVILIRRAGGSAYVETENGHVVVRCDRSLAWVRRVCRAANYSPPSR